MQLDGLVRGYREGHPRRPSGATRVEPQIVYQPLHTIPYAQAVPVQPQYRPVARIEANPANTPQMTASRARNWRNRQRGAAAWEGNPGNSPDSHPQAHLEEVNDTSGHGHGHSSSSEHVCACHDGGDFTGVSLRAARVPWTPQERAEMNRRRAQNLCLRCAGQGHYQASCENPESKLPPKEGGNEGDSTHPNKDIMRAVFSPDGTTDPTSPGTGILWAVFSVKDREELQNEWKLVEDEEVLPFSSDSGNGAGAPGRK